MAIYSLHHSPVGKSTQAQPYTAAAHIGYITRKNAMSQMRFERIPAATPRQMAAYLRGCEDTDRKNARVIDKLMLALPRELNSEQRAELVRGFAEDVTSGRAPWLAAFHEKGKDRQNPHCHLVLRDRDYETGKRVIGTSEVGSTERLRQKWEEHANRALQLAGCQARIDRRTLEAQGVERQPTIHEGPQSQAMDRRGARPKSRRRTLRNRPGSRSTHRSVDYSAIDRGISRPEVNRSRRVGGYESEQDYWAAIDAHHADRDMQGRAAVNEPGSVNGVVVLFGVGKVPGNPELAHRLVRDPVVVLRQQAPDGRIPNRPDRVDEVINTNPKPSHVRSVGRLTGSERKTGMKDLKGRRILEQQFDEAKRRFDAEDARFRYLVDTAYDKPETAMENMNKFSYDNGQDKFIAQLAKDPGSFGKLNSDKGTWQSLKSDAPEKRNAARRAQKELPDVVRNADKHLKDGKAARKSLEDEGHWPRQAENPGKHMQARNRPKEARAPTSEPAKATPRDMEPHDHFGLHKKPPVNGEQAPRVLKKPSEKIVGGGKGPDAKPGIREGRQPDHPQVGPQEKPSFSNRLRNQQAPSNPTSIDQPAPERLQRVQPPSKEEHQQPKPDSSGIDAPSKPASKPSFSQRLREPPATPAPASKAVEKPRGKTPSHEIEM